MHRRNKQVVDAIKHIFRVCTVQTQTDFDKLLDLKVMQLNTRVRNERFEKKCLGFDFRIYVFFLDTLRLTFYK